MESPNSLTIIRHGKSAYNANREDRKSYPLSDRLAWYVKKKPDSFAAVAITEALQEKFPLNFTADNMPLMPLQPGTLSDEEKIGKKLRERGTPLPAVAMTSPAKRAQQTLERIRIGWPELKKVPTKRDMRLRELDRGLAYMYPGWEAFVAYYPEQRKLHKKLGTYRYRFPCGESCEAVMRGRLTRWLEFTFTYYKGRDVLIVSHHITILLLRALLEGWPREKIARLVDSNDHEEFPFNGSVTTYAKNTRGKSLRKMLLVEANAQLY